MKEEDKSKVIKGKFGSEKEIKDSMEGFIGQVVLGAFSMFYRRQRGIGLNEEISSIEKVMLSKYPKLTDRQIREESLRIFYYNELMLLLLTNIDYFKEVVNSMDMDPAMKDLNKKYRLVGDMVSGGVFKRNKRK